MDGVQHHWDPSEQRSPPSLANSIIPGTSEHRQVHIAGVGDLPGSGKALRVVYAMTDKFMYVCMYIHICIHNDIYMCVYVYMYIHRYICRCMYIDTHMQVYMDAYMHRLVRQHVQ